MKVIIFDADKFGKDLIRIIYESNALLISKDIGLAIYQELIKTALKNESKNI